MTSAISNIPLTPQLLQKLQYDNKRLVHSGSSCFKLLPKHEIIMAVALSILMSSSFYIAASNCSFKGRYAFSTYFILTSAYPLALLLLSLRTNHKIEKLEKLWLSKLARSGFELKDLPTCLHDKKGLILAAVKNEPHAIKYAPLLYKYDEEIVSTAIKSAKSACMYLPYKLDDIVLIEFGPHHD